MGDKYLSDVIDVEQIISASESRFCIISGVGSGKNYFVENVLTQYGNVFYISSRRAKVNEILTDENFHEKIDWDKGQGDVVVTTNYGIQQLLRSEKFGRGMSEVIEHFDYFVVDEAHSLFTDAVFAESSFDLKIFVEHITKKFSKKKVILMTGTPEPMRYMLEKYKYVVIDKMQECINVMPKVIREISLKQAIAYIRELPETEKTIYLGNSASGLVKGKKSIYAKICENGGVSEKEVAFCMSESRSRELTRYVEKIKEKSDALKTYVSQNNRLPDEVRILLTTSTLKEGINILEDDVKVAFCESHLLSDIQQFAGRVRVGLDTLFIIKDARQHEVTIEDLNQDMLEIHCAVKNELNAINDYFREVVCNSDSWLYKLTEYDGTNTDLHDIFFQGDMSLYTIGGDASRYYIDLIEQRNRFVRYNHITSQFEIDNFKGIERKRIYECLNNFAWKNQIDAFCDLNEIEYVPVEAEELIDENEILDVLEELEGTILFDNDKTDFIYWLCEKLAISGNPKLKTINQNLDMYMIRYKIVSKASRDNKILKRGIKIEKK